MINAPKYHAERRVYDIFDNEQQNDEEVIKNGLFYWVIFKFWIAIENPLGQRRCFKLTQTYDFIFQYMPMRLI